MRDLLGAARLLRTHTLNAAAVLGVQPLVSLQQPTGRLQGEQVVELLLRLQGLPHLFLNGVVYVCDPNEVPRQDEHTEYPDQQERHPIAVREPPGQQQHHRQHQHAPQPSANTLFIAAVQLLNEGQKLVIEPFILLIMFTHANCPPFTSVPFLPTFR